MKWVFVIAGLAMVVIGGIGKYVDMTKYKEPFISGNSPWYTVFMTGVIAVILGLSFDWIMSLDDEEEEEEAPAGEAEDQPEEEATQEQETEAKEEEKPAEEATESAAEQGAAESESGSESETEASAEGEKSSNGTE